MHIKLLRCAKKCALSSGLTFVWVRGGLLKDHFHQVKLLLRSFLGRNNTFCSFLAPLEELNGWEPGCTLCILGFLHVTPGTYHLSLNSSHLTPTRDDSCLPGTDSSRLGRDSSQPQRHSSQPQRHTSQPGTSYLTTLSSNHTPRTLRHRFINHQFKTLMSYLICHDPHLTPDASHLSFRIPDLLHLL